jgi:hypothetical protein
VPRTVLQGNVWVKPPIAITGGGSLIIELVDSTGAIINDDAGTANSVTTPLANIPTTYTGTNSPIQFTWRTPAVLNTNTPYKVRFRIATTAIPTGQNLYIDHFSLAAPTSLYPNGPFVSFYSGSAKWVINDTFKIVPSNDYAGKFALMLDEVLNIKNLQSPNLTPGTQIPSAASATSGFEDTLITQ